jgi:DNA-directed RNA polymerase specialized sigma24 family protein
VSPSEDCRYGESTDDSAVKARCASIRAQWSAIERLIHERLTRRQREIIELHFFRGFDQPAIAVLLGISQQTVSEHLFGKLRNGIRIGGIIPKLRKLYERGLGKPSDPRNGLA